MKFMLIRKLCMGVHPENLSTWNFWKLKDTSLKGMAKRKQIAIKLGKGDKELVINLLITLTKTKAPVPGFLTVNFQVITLYMRSTIEITKSWVRNRKGISNNQSQARGSWFLKFKMGNRRDNRKRLCIRHCLYGM